MKLTSATRNFIKAAVVAVAMVLIGMTGLDIPRATVEEVVDEQFERVTPTESRSVPTEGPYGRLEVIDGDTLVVLEGGTGYTVRLIGIDTPEVEGSPQGAECFGAEATERLRAVLDGQLLFLAADPTQANEDVYNRWLRYATLEDGRDVGEILIREGYAREYTYAAPYQKQEAYRTAEQAAKQAGLGLWGCE